MKIGIDARMFSDSFTGIGRYTFELTKRFFHDHKEVEWVLFMNDPEYSHYKTPKGVKKVLVDAPHYSLAEQTRFLRILRREKCDLVHFTHFNVPLLYNSPFVVTIHDTTINFYPGKKMNTPLRKRAYNMVMRHAIFASKAIITVSQNTREDVVKLYKANPLKILPIHNGIGEEFQPSGKKSQNAVRERYALQNPFLLYTGVWREHKNLVGLLHAFRQVRNHHPKLDLVLTGKPDPHYPEVERTIRELDLEKAVRRVGLVDFQDLLELYTAAEVFVFPSFYEGFGLPPLEAMKVGTPAAVSQVASLPEVCGNAVSYFDPTDPLDIARGIRAILEDEKYRKQLIKTGREHVKQFSWDEAAAETFAVYSAVLDGTFAV